MHVRIKLVSPWDNSCIDVMLVDSTSMNFGYARVSTDEQTTAAQVEALKAAGCEDHNIFKESISGGSRDRPELNRILEYARKGDVLVVWKLDRLSRSLSDLLFILDKLEHRGVAFKSLTESIDTSSPAGKLIMHVIGAFAEFERGIIRERTKLGLQRARAHGKILGARHKLTKIQQAEALKMIADHGRTQAEVAEIFNVDKSTISRLANKA
jgi:DNA invertase Pin-like site-specific DNA recombinase